MEDALARVLVVAQSLKARKGPEKRFQFAFLFFARLCSSGNIELACGMFLLYVRFLG